MQWFEIQSGVYEVTTDLDINLWRRALTEITSCGDSTPDHHCTQDDLGARTLKMSTAACQEILQYFRSDDWLHELSAMCDSNQEWILNWTQPSTGWFRKYTNFAYHWHIVPPNYTNHIWHVDNLRAVVHGMMYLCEHHDSRATTLFRGAEHDTAITTGFNRGWIILQNGRQYHRGINYSNSERYSFKWVMALYF